MGRVSEKYDEAALCPRMMPLAWWYTIPSQTRQRISREVGLTGVGVYIGEMQDRLLDAGLGRLAGTYMRAMQACLDADEQEEARKAETLREVVIGDIGGKLMPVETITTYENAAGRHDHPHFGFHEPRA